MKAYETSRGHLFDLEHVMVIGPLFEDYKMEPSYGFHIKLAFNTSQTLAFETAEDAKLEHAKLQAAWLEHKIAQQPKMPTPVAAPRPAPVQSPTAVEQPAVPPVQGPTAVQQPAKSPVQGPTVVQDDVAAALAAAGIALENGVPVERAAVPAPSNLDAGDAGYRSSFA